MADLTPIPMGIPWDPWDPSLPHSRAHLYCTGHDTAIAILSVCLSVTRCNYLYE